MLKPPIKFILVILVIALFFLFSYYKFSASKYLIFSDSAKFANIARILLEHHTYGTSFTFFSESIFKQSTNDFFSARAVPIAMPFSITAMFLLIGVSDVAVVMISAIYYLALVIAVFLLGRHFYGNVTGFIASLLVLTNINFLDYATSGAAEPLFSLLIVIALWMLFQKKKYTDLLLILVSILIYLTKPQGILFISLLFVGWLLLHYSIKKTVIMLTTFLLLIFLVDKYILYTLSWRYPAIYPIFTRGIQAFLQYSPKVAVSDALRGGLVSNVQIAELGKKTFYNLYNFYKLLPNILSPYILVFFILSLFFWTRRKSEIIFRFVSLLMIVGTFFMTALMIPFYRYLHPVVPLVYILASSSIVIILRLTIKTHASTTQKYLPKSLNDDKKVGIVTIALVLFFVAGQSLGIIFLDSRVKADLYNLNKPPIYVTYAEKLKTNAGQNDVIVTNLDTWGSWYGDRKTIWFPLKPEMLESINDNIDAIYLTDYKIDDENYYMGDEWREIFNNPTSHHNDFINRNFKFAGEFVIPASETYENQEGRAVLFLKKTS